MSALCRRLRIPINVADAPSLCTFTLLSTHSDGPLQIGITTSGRGCKLAARIRREVASCLPRDLGAAVERLGAMRRRIWEEDHRAHDADDLGPPPAVNGTTVPVLGSGDAGGDVSDDDAPGQSAAFNRLVLEEDPEVERARNAARTRRMRWLTQICEYWPLRKLAAITEADIDGVLRAYSASSEPATPAALDPSTPGATFDLSPGPSNPSKPGPPAPGPSKQRPKMILAGAGPGSPHLLTLATQRAIQTAAYILADKLVPQGVLDLIPRRTPVHIARKFPGNAEAAQQELLALGLAALARGQTVLRLKQGDPYIYGRGAEELAFFRRAGYEVLVLPGITSALSAPLFAGIPATHRGVAECVVVCTGTGRRGRVGKVPGFEVGVSVVVLMGLHRLGELVAGITEGRKGEASWEGGGQDESTGVDGGGEAGVAKRPWPPSTPCAVLERASCPDQRIIRSTLEHVVQAVEVEGSRPPGLLVIGACCEVLQGTGGSRWVVEEGFTALDELMAGPEMALGGMEMAGASPVRA